MRRFTKAFCAIFLLWVLPLNLHAQQPKLIKVSEFSITNIATIEERVFMIHSITDQGYFCFKNPDINNTIDVYVASNASDELSDFDFFYDNLLYEQRNAFILLDKATRGNLFVQWRQRIDDEIYKLLYEDFTKGMRSENPTCETSLPFCTNNGLYNFPAGVDAGSAGSGDPYHCSTDDGHQGQDNCLTTSPNPAFYFMRIDEPGNLDIYMYSTPSHDIDFDCWGPFDDITDACDQLSCSNMVDCSYDPASTEHCHINNAQNGQYYVLLITNFSNQACNINFVNQGTGTTDCSILPPLVNNDGPYCIGETIHLSAVGQPGATYNWTGPNNFTSTLQNPVIENCTTAMSGNYTCTITLAGETNSAVTTLSVFAIPEASFEATTVCLGNPTTFNSTASTSDGQQITSYDWDFGDGATESGENVSHTFAQAGTYNVTHHVNTRAGCESQVTLPVVVVAAPVASFTATTVCQGEATQFTSTSTGDQISGFQWNFGDGQTGSGQTVSHTYAQAGNFQVTLTAEGSGGTCSGNTTQSVTVHAMPAPVATANPYSVQFSEASTITVNPGAEGNFTYHWEPANMVTNPDSQTTQTVPLTETQLYTVTVTNTQGGCTSTAYVTVSMDGSNLTATATVDQSEICDGSSTTLHAIPAGGTGNYTFSWTPAATLSNPSGMNPVATPAVGTTTYACHISDGIISQDVSVSVTVHPNKSTDIHQAICDGTSYNFFGQNLTEEGVYHHTLQTQHGCDSVINLHLEKMQVFETTLSDYFCEGDTYTFFGQQLSAPGTYSHTMQTQQGCDSIVKLNLNISPVEHSQFTVPDSENCDSYFWDPRGHQIVQTDHADMTYTASGTYHRTYLNSAGCDSIVTMNVRFEYTPDPTPIYPVDEANTAPHWVVSATEFQINTYDFQLWDNNPLCYWDTVTWTLEGASDWFVEPFGNKAKQCKVYVLSQESDTVWLTARAFNRCAPSQGVERKYWLVCSFYGIDELDAEKADFSVVPNPNNGLMTLNFERLTGKVNVKVYDMQGALIDDFETFNGDPVDSYTYTMKDKADGIYFFVATGREGTKAKKVVIQH